MYSVNLNKDKSLLLEILDSGKYYVSSSHSNMKNSKTLCDNVKRALDVEQDANRVVVRMNGEIYAEVDKKTQRVDYTTTLTSFETRQLAQSRGRNDIPFARIKNNPVRLTTDLHTHFAGALSPEQLIECALGNGITFSKTMLEKAKIDYKQLTPLENGEYLLDDIILNTRNRQLLINSMKIDTSEQETFNKMEDIYYMRGPITKNRQMFIPMVEAIAKDCQASGVKYIELSLSSIISDVEQHKLLEYHMPRIERETGVKVRFLGSLWRHSDKEWNADEVDRLRVSAGSPYVVGCDFMGHETNSTMEFYDNIKDLAKYAMTSDPDFVIRVHAGENPLFKANARQVLLAVEEARYELERETGKRYKYPQVRLGHGIYGFDEPAPWDEKERTQKITMQQLCDEIKPIIEFNMSSNLSLNNINSLREIPIKAYLDKGIQVVLGTDGKGIYSTDLDQEMILAHRAGLTIEDLKKIARTEAEIQRRAALRFKAHSKFSAAELAERLKNCYTNGTPQYTNEVYERNRKEKIRIQRSLGMLIRHSGAVTNLEEVESAIAGKKPIMLTGSSAGHWGKISEGNQDKIRVALEVLIQCIDPQKAYLVTGGTNHGVEREAHIIVDRHNKTSKEKLVLLGTLTEEAANRETNSIEKNTITHAIIPTLNGTPAKRWFDLPDTVLADIQEKDGYLVAIGGGSIVSDIIQRAHNLGIDMSMMAEVEGASGDKSKSLKGNGYDFVTPQQLVMKIIRENPGLIKAGINERVLDIMTHKAEQRIYGKTEEKTDGTLIQKMIKKEEKKENEQMETKKVVLTSLDPEAYPDLEVECKVVENMEEYTRRMLAYYETKGVTPRYAQKTAVVEARPGKVGEEITTRVGVERDGKKYILSETVNTVKVEGSMIVTNPDGEEYIVKPETFAKKYKPTEQAGKYTPVATPIRCIEVGQDIVFPGPWGSEEVAMKGAILNISDLEKVYAIQNEAFAHTYTEHNPALNQGMKPE